MRFERRQFSSLIEIVLASLRAVSAANPFDNLNVLWCFSSNSRHDYLVKHQYHLYLKDSSEPSEKPLILASHSQRAFARFLNASSIASAFKP